MFDGGDDDDDDDRLGISAKAEGLTTTQIWRSDGATILAVSLLEAAEGRIEWMHARGSLHGPDLYSTSRDGYAPLHGMNLATQTSIFFITSQRHPELFSGPAE